MSLRKKLISALTCGLSAVVLALTGCGGVEHNNVTTTAAPSADTSPAAQAESETVHVAGDFTITLYADKAPISCENFESLVEQGFYEGSSFHRIVEGFLAQGGAPQDYTETVQTIKGEFSGNGVENDLSHTRGIVSMVRGSDPDSASSQFFICYSDDDVFLDGNYAAFGEVTEGMDVVDSFLKVERVLGSDGAVSSPVNPITITKAEMIDPDGNGNHRAKFHVEFDYEEYPPRETVDGEFVITLYADKAPISCENFEKLVSEGFYDGLTFHRIREGFMAQGGDPLGNGKGGSSQTIKGEFSQNGVENDLSHTRGIVSMARSTDPDSASSQFFICYDDCSSDLDGRYAAFGEVTEGMEVVDGFLEVRRTMGTDGKMSSPTSPITITKAEMIDPDENGNHRAKFYVTY